MNLVSLAFRNLRRRPIRTCLSVVGIGIAVGSALAVMALSRSIQDGAREGLGEFGGDLVVMPKGASGLFAGFIPENALERIGAIPGVAQMSGELVAFAPADTAGNVLTLGWSDTSYLWKKVPLREGRMPAPGERRVALLGGAAADSLGKRLNGEVKLFGESFRIVGIADYASTVNRGAIVVPLADLQDVSYRPRQVTIAVVSVENARDRAELLRIREDIQASGNVVAAPAAEALGNDRNFAILEAASLAVALIALAMSALNVLTVLAMATHERTREIGIFVAIGWSTGRIINSIVIEGMLLCLVGCALVVLFSFLIAYGGPHIPAIGHLISFKPGASVIALVLGAAFVLCILGALAPAWRAARILPAEALRRM